MKFGLLAAGITAAIASGSFASIATLDIQTNTTTNTWYVYVTISGDSKGLASFNIDVTGTGDVTVASSTVKAKQTPVYDDEGEYLYASGFSLYRSAYTGVPGNLITASQDTTATDEGYLVYNAGVTSAYLIAQGTYDFSTGGTLTVDVHSGGLINVFPSTYALGGSTEAATVISDSIAIAAVPEPASLTLLGIASTCLLAKRRRR